jgi:glyoxylase-like metal-dependent hydrolase (beta-lactamase superfamily II)
VSVGDDGILIVDDQYAPLADKIQAALRELGTGKVRFVLNTHWHGDHTGGNVAFGSVATILAHTNVRRRLETRQEGAGRVVEPMPAIGLPVITYDEGLSIHLNGEQIQATHFPAGHTDGDTVVRFHESNVVHLGDLFWAGMFPFVDLESGGDVEGLARNVRRILDALPDGARIIPGHGPLATAADLERYHAMLVGTTEVVRGATRAGKTLDEIRAAGLPAEWTDWGKGFISTEKWIETVHRSLTRGKG